MKWYLMALTAVTLGGCADSEPAPRESIGTEGTGAASRVDAAVPDPLPPVSSNPVRWYVVRVAEVLTQIGLKMEGVADSVDATFLSARGSRMMFVAPVERERRSGSSFGRALGSSSAAAHLVLS